MNKRAGAQGGAGESREYAAAGVDLDLVIVTMQVLALPLVAPKLVGRGEVSFDHYFKKACHNSIALNLIESALQSEPPVSCLIRFVGRVGRENGKSGAFPQIERHSRNTYVLRTQVVRSNGSLIWMMVSPSK